MRTIIYVDGFNLYYGALKGTPYKWLNIKELMVRLLKAENEIVAVKYFTARVSASPSDPDKANHQDAYLRALQATTPELKIYYGQFTTWPVRARLINPIAGQRYVDVSRTSEKGSDVNLAVHLLNDAWLGAYECGVVVSRDSDLAESLKLVKMFHPDKALGLVWMTGKFASKELVSQADFVKKITTAALRASTFPPQIPGTNITKPPDW